MGRSEIKVFLGVDMAKGEHYVQAITTDGKELFGRAVQNDQAALEKLLADATAHGPVAVAVDMTSAGARLLLGVMAQHQVPVAYVSGLVMRRAADLYAGAAKTDTRDAWVLADYARRNPDRLQWTEINDELLVRLRVLNGHDTDLAGDTNRTINRCRDALLALSPALERVLRQRLTQPGVRDLLAKWPTPTALATAGRTKIRNTIGKRSPRLATRLTTHILAAIDAQTVTLPAESTWGEVITNLIGDPKRIQTRPRQLMTQIEETFLHHPLGQVLNSLPGFGPRTGARTLAEIGDPYRFKNGSRLASYAGLAPVNHRSGRSINRTTQHRGSNHRLKNAMFLAAFVASRHDPTAKAYYQRKRSEGKHHNAAVICVARRRCDIILAMLKDEALYNPDHPKTDLTVRIKKVPLEALRL